MPTETFTERKDWSSIPIRSLGLGVSGTRLEPILTQFGGELERAGIRRVKPVFYLSTEWGVPFGTVAIAIPFYLAHPDLTRLHAERAGHVEGFSPADILRYLRHEMGHVVNYAYKLYERDDWVKLFGPIDKPYVEEYRAVPFSRRFVRHLPGWYAQKHPDEDWAETFAVWMTPNLDWKAEYADRPTALAKLEYCDRTLAELKERDPVVTAADLDEDVSELSQSLDEFYGPPDPEEQFPHALDGALRSLFEDLTPSGDGSAKALQPAGELIRSLERRMMDDVYRWTGHFPERTRRLVRHLAKRARQMKLAYAEACRVEAAVALTTLVTALAMNHVHGGSYLP